MSTNSQNAESSQDGATASENRNDQQQSTSAVTSQDNFIGNQYWLTNQYPVYQQSFIPTYQQSFIPTFQQLSIPTYQQSPLTTYYQPSAPIYQQSSIPTYQQSSVSGYQQPSVPCYQQSLVPGYQHSSVPYYQQSSAQSYQQSSVPGYQQSSVPSSQLSSVATYQQPITKTYQQPSVPTYQQLSAPSSQEIPVPTFQQTSIPTLQQAAIPTDQQPAAVTNSQQTQNSSGSLLYQPVLPFQIMPKQTVIPSLPAFPTFMTVPSLMLPVVTRDGRIVQVPILGQGLPSVFPLLTVMMPLLITPLVWPILATQGIAISQNQIPTQQYPRPEDVMGQDLIYLTTRKRDRSQCRNRRSDCSREHVCDGNDGQGASTSTMEGALSNTNAQAPAISRPSQPLPVATSQARQVQHVPVVSAAELEQDSKNGEDACNDTEEDNGTLQENNSASNDNSHPQEKRRK